MGKESPRRFDLLMLLGILPHELNRIPSQSWTAVLHEKALALDLPLARPCHSSRNRVISIFEGLKFDCKKPGQLVPRGLGEHGGGGRPNLTHPRMAIQLKDRSLKVPNPSLCRRYSMGEQSSDMPPSLMAGSWQCPCPLAQFQA